VRKGGANGTTVRRKEWESAANRSTKDGKRGRHGEDRSLGSNWRFERRMPAPTRRCVDTAGEWLAHTQSVRRSMRVGGLSVHGRASSCDGHRVGGSAVLPPLSICSQTAGTSNKPPPAHSLSACPDRSCAVLLCCVLCVVLYRAEGPVRWWSVVIVLNRHSPLRWRPISMLSSIPPAQWGTGRGQGARRTRPIPTSTSPPPTSHSQGPQP
jgi:hypothetical protein